jgi:hypothetical protein
MRSFAVLAIAFAWAASGCGRTSPELDFCPAHEGVSCTELATERAAKETEYTAAVTAGDSALVDARGKCVQSFVAEQLEDGCITADTSSLCGELCTLHPCAVRAANGTPDPSASCPSRCAEEQQDSSISVDALEAALRRAAGTPGLCTCAICDVDSAGLCRELWVCG